MKVGIVNQPFGRVSYPPVDAIGIWSHQAAARLGEGFDVRVFGPGRAGQGETEVLGGVRYSPVVPPSDGWSTHVFRLFAPLAGPRRPVFAWNRSHRGYAREVARRSAAEGLDVVHVHNFSQFPGVIRSLSPGSKIVLHMHCEWLTQLDRGMIEERLEEVDLVIGCSEYITGKVRREFPRFADRCRTVYNGVDTSLFQPPEDRGEGKETGGNRILFVGRISPEKGLHVLVDAFARVLEEVPDAELRLVGAEWRTPLEFLVSLTDDLRRADFEEFYRGTYTDSLRRRVPAKVADRITFAGHTGHPEIAERYREAGVLVNPSFSESFGMSLIEAMASGVPVVAAPVGGMSEIVEDGKTGLLVPAGDSEALAGAILSVLRDRDLACSLAKAGRTSVEERFTWDRVVKDLAGEYRRLLEDHA